MLTPSVIAALTLGFSPLALADVTAQLVDARVVSRQESAVLRAHEVPDGRHVLWNWVERTHPCFLDDGGRRTELGNCMVLPFGSAGQLIALDERVGWTGAALCDIDPAKNALRVLWEDASTRTITPVGASGGAFWFFAANGTDSPLIELRSDLTARRIELGIDAQPALGDSIRDRRLLVASFDRAMVSAGTMQAPTADAELAVIDLESLSIRPVGRVAAVRGLPVGETIFLPTLSVAWGDQRCGPQKPPRERYLVSEATEAIFRNPVVER